ncbi:uncharacterized protein LOC121306508 isoform X2 [Polyodon spathula]|uniref:uncharacterized protein LOC121306508 isoform X2 n=1 Tax=Polyodon spathula TaxID=7913 RepID=UPI001B7DF11A|nr:uncharacterized protein LOC121306508 isoform X2 [Polyodon spathula]XP_041094187.1 uncharacterized protein LOC121306508 isoform X2 [Polyodon spathula]
MVRFAGCGSVYITGLQFQIAWLNDCQSEYNWSPHCYFKAAQKIYTCIHLDMNTACGVTTYGLEQTMELPGAVSRRGEEACIRVDLLQSTMEDSRNSVGVSLQNRVPVGGGRSWTSLQRILGRSPTVQLKRFPKSSRGSGLRLAGMVIL